MIEKNPFQTNAESGEVYGDACPPRRFRAFHQSIWGVPLFRSILTCERIQPKTIDAKVVTWYAMPTYTVATEDRAVRGLMLREVLYAPNDAGGADIVPYDHPWLHVAYTHPNGYTLVGPLNLQPIYTYLPGDERGTDTALREVAVALEIWQQAMRRYASLCERMGPPKLGAPDKYCDVRDLIISEPDVPS